MPNYRAPRIRSTEITPEEIDKAKAKFDLITTHHLLLGNGLCAVVKPKLMLNLYWSYWWSR